MHRQLGEVLSTMGGLTACDETLAQEHVLVTLRVVVHHRDDFESVPGIERRSLEAERHEQHLSAAPPARLLFCRREQPRPPSLPTPRLRHPELANFRAPAPRIPADPGDHPMIVVSHEDRQPLAIRDARRGGVELIQPILQVLDFAWRRLGAADEFRSGHCLIPGLPDYSGRNSNVSGEHAVAPEWSVGLLLLGSTILHGMWGHIASMANAPRRNAQRVCGAGVWCDDSVDKVGPDEDLR